MRNRAMPSRVSSAFVFCVLATLSYYSSAGAQTGQITGTVTDELVAPVAGLAVQLEDPFGGYLADTTTAAGTGAYAFAGLADGDYLVKVFSDPAMDLVGEYFGDVNEFDTDLADRITIAGGATVAGVDFVLSPGGSISGSVSGLMVGETVQLQAHDAFSGRFRGGFDSDAGFGYTIDSLPAGTYLLFAETGGTDRAIQWWDGQVRQSFADAVALAADEDVIGKDFVLTAGTSISGTVALSPDPGDGGATVQQMWVEAFDPVSHAHVRSQNPDTAGSYAVGNLPPGSYGVLVQPHGSGYVSEVWVPGAELPGQPPVLDRGAAEPIAVAVGSPASGVDLLLEVGRSISGHAFLESLVENGVQDPGEPDVADAEVSAGLLAGGFGAGTRTDAGGDYTVVGLVDGMYSIQVESSSPAEPFVAEVWDDKTLFEIADAVDVTAGDASGIDFSVVQRRVISGKVFLDFDGDQVQDAGEPSFSNVSVRATRVDGFHAGHAAHAGDGSYSIGLLPGSYTLEALPHQPGVLAEHWSDVFFIEEALPIDVTASDASGVDFGLIASATVGTLRGQVIAADTLLGIPGVDVDVWRFDNQGFVRRTSTDAGGNFVFADLPPSPPGGYKVVFHTGDSNAVHDSDYVTAFWSASGDPGSIDPDDLRVTFPTLPDPPGGPGTDLGSFALAVGGSISGTVFPPGGESLPEGLTVSAQSFESGGAPLPGAPVDGGGAYRIRGLPAPATYRVQADTFGSDFVPVYYLTAAESTFDHDTAAPVAVAVAVETAGIDLHLVLGGSISGTVTRDADGTPVVNFHVSAHLDQDPLGRGFWAGAQTELDGTYHLRGLPSGSYEVSTSGRDGDLANEYYPGLVAVAAPAETSGIDFALAAAGRIRGRVTQTVAMVAEPVVNIRVEASDFATGQFFSDGHTDAAGDYVIGALPQGRSYRVRVATQDGNDPQFFNFIGEFYDDRLLYETADAVAVPVDPGGGVSEVLDVDFELALGGAISGLVTDGGGSPLQSVWVHADDFAGTSFGNGDHTDQNGFFVVRGLAAGSYRVRADPYPQDFVSEYFDDTYDHNLATPVSVAAVPEGGSIPITQDIDFELADAFSVSGLVTEDDGTTPIAGLPMSANGIDVAAGGGSTTLADGSYQISGLPAGRYDVVTETDGTSFIRQQQEVDLSAGNVSGVDFALAAGASISGRTYEDTIANGVYDPGEEQADVAVTAYDFFTGEFAASAISGADGSYQIQGLGAGSYRIETEPDERNFVRQFWDGAFRHDQAVAVEIVDGAGLKALVDVAGIDFRLARGFEIRGLVFFDPNGDGIRQGGEPAVSNVHVNADHLDQPIHAHRHVEPDGTYVLHGVLPGQYQVYVHAQGTPYASELYRLVGGLPVGTFRRSEADAVDVSAGDATGVDFSLVLGGGVTGTVIDASTSMPLANVDVNVNAFDEDGLGFGNRSGSDGRFLIDGLPPGSYRVSAFDSQGIYVAEFHQDAQFYEDASPVAVVARSSTGDPLATLVDFDLGEGGAIEGLIYHDQNQNGVRDGGEPAIGGVHVDAQEHAAPHRGLAGATSGAGGSFRIGGLPPGQTLRLWTNTYPSDFLQVYYDGGGDLGSPDGDDAVALAVAAGGTLTGIDFGLVLGGAISGQVFDGDGVPIAGIWVNAGPFTSGNYGAGDSTAADGTYTLHALETGDYRVDAGGDPYRFEYWDDRTQFNAADPVSVTNGATTGGVDFVLPLEPRILSGPVPAFGDRDTTVVGVTVTAENLSPAALLELGGDGLTIQNLVLAAGTFTFDVAIAADAPLGKRSLSVINDQVLEDAADVLGDAFEVRRGATPEAPHAERLYVADNGSAQIRVYGAADFSLLGTVDLCCQPGPVVASAGGFVFTRGGDRAISVVDTRLGTVGEEVSRLVPDAAGALAATADFLYVADAFLQVVGFVETATWESAGEISVGAFPTALELDPAGATLWVANRDDDTLSLIDVDTASATLHQVLATVPLPAGASPRGIAFTPAGARAWVVGRQATYEIDAALALSDPATALINTLSTPGSGRGVIDVAAHPASGKDLAYLQAGGQVWVVDVSAPQPEVLRTFVAGFSIAGILATADRLYLIHDGSHDFYAVDTAELLSSPALSMTRFDGPEAPGGAVTPSGGVALAPTPGAPPGAPTVTVTGGSPAANGTAFTVTLSGSGFAPDAFVWLRGTVVRGTVTANSATSLTVDFPALTPAGDHPVVVTNPAPGGGASGVSSNTLQVTPPPGFAPTQEVYAASYGTGRLTVYEPGGTAAEIFPQPYPSGISITPDGRLAFVGQLYWSPETPEQLADNALDVTAVDLDPDSPTYRQVIATVPYAMSNFSAPAVTPAIDNPNGIFAYMPNFFFDAVTLIDAETLAEVDVDGDPGTESIPPFFFPGKLDGITRIELGGAVWPSVRGPNETALTPDGNLLYVVNRNASVAIVDAVTRQVVGELLNGGDFGQLRRIVTDGTYVYVTGDDGAGQPHLFAFQAGVLDDSGFVLKTPISELPSGAALSADGDFVFMTARFAGELMIADVSQIGSLLVTVQIVPIATGLYEVAEASEDQLLWVSNAFRSAIYAVDLAPGPGPGQFSVVTTLGSPVCPLGLAVPPVLASGLPVVGGVSPSSGDVAGGDPVIVTGANFENGAVVRFGANLATGVVVDSSFSIRAVTPASSTGTGPVDVEVENPGGASGVLAAGFTYVQDLTPPVFTVPPFVASQSLTGDPATVTAEIRWTTDEASTSVVDYRRVGQPVFAQASSPGLVKNHVVMVSGLPPATDMEFRATSADAQGNSASSPPAPAVATFTTLSGPDTTPPIIVSGPTVTPTTGSAQVQWTTNEQATSIVQFDAVLDDGNFDRQAFGASGTLHSVTLTALTAATQHEYKVISVDPSGNPVESPKLYFTTAAFADVTPPVVTGGPAVSYLSNDLVIVTWTTDEPSTSFVNYGTASVLEQSVVDLDAVTTHVVFLTNLLPGTAYGYQFGSTDASGNTVVSTDPFAALARPQAPRTLAAPLRVGGVVLAEGSTLTVLGASAGFTTAAIPDTTPPEVLAVEVTPLSFDRVLIAVTVDEAASLRASFGVGGLTDQAFAPSFSQTPDLVLAGLAAGTTYQLSLELTDPRGNAATVTGLEFVTPAAPDVQAPVISALTVTALTATTARIEWQTDEPADSTVGFGLAAGPLDRQAGLLGLRRSHAVLLTGLAPSTAYAFEAASRDASGNRGTATGGLTTLTAAPVVTSLTPPQARQGRTLEIAVNGANFGFDSVVSFGAGIAAAVSSVNQIGTRIQVSVTVSLAAVPGPRPVTVTTGGQVAVGSFTVLDGGVIFFDGFESGDTSRW